MSTVIGKIEVLADQTSHPRQGIEVVSAIRPFVGDGTSPDFEVSRQDRPTFRGNASEAETALSAATCSLADQTGPGQGMRTSNLSFFPSSFFLLYFSLPLFAPLSRLKGPSTSTSAHRTSEPDGRTRQGEHELSMWAQNSNKKKQRSSFDRNWAALRMDQYKMRTCGPAGQSGNKRQPSSPSPTFLTFHRLGSSSGIFRLGGWVVPHRPPNDQTTARK